MKKQTAIWLFVGMIFIIPVLAYAGFTLYERYFQKLPVYDRASAMPAFTLTDQDNNTATLDDWNNRIVVVDFFFTHCPGICPKMTNSLKRVQDAFAADDILIRSFSVDPERDDPKQLQAYAGKFGIETSNWSLLTGDKKQIYKLARNGFMIVATDGDGGPNDFIHSEKLVLVDKQKRIRGYYDGTSEQEVNMLIRDIKKLKHEQ
jgi:Uncharacterized protein SCO1/SenC/PrrC, involved in biogenesis of respiratory and photosynthetic systems